MAEAGADGLKAFSAWLERAPAAVRAALYAKLAEASRERLARRVLGREAAPEQRAEIRHLQPDKASALEALASGRAALAEPLGHSGARGLPRPRGASVRPEAAARIAADLKTAVVRAMRKGRR